MIEIELSYDEAMLVDNFLHLLERSNRVEGVKIACQLNKSLRAYCKEVCMELYEPKMMNKMKDWFNLADDATKPVSKLKLKAK